MKKIIYSLLLITSFFIFSTATAQTNVSGGIYSNTTWTKANSPYIVTDTVVVFPGVTLTIDPGVTVKFADKMRLEIRGALIAVGTITDSITFTSNSSFPIPGIWSEIFGQGTFNFCNFFYANKGVYGGANGNPLIIRNSVFANNIEGFWAGNVICDSCLFFNNTYEGFNAGGGTISNSIILNNSTGMTLGGGSGIRVNLLNCIVKLNSLGVDAGGNSGGATLKYCTIDSNSVTGVSIASDSVINCQIRYNGVGIKAGIGSKILQNVITNNTIGIQLENPVVTIIYCNKICSNVSYDLKYLVSGTNISLPSNYWCTPDSISTTARIYDGYDNISYGLVSFMPLDTQNCYLTGCLLGVTANVTNATCDTCHNGSATVQTSNGFAPYVYTWYTSPIQATQTATGLASGTYTVCVTDGNGCTACKPIFVDSTNCTGFAVHANAANATCSTCNDGSASVSVSLGSPPYKYTWYTAPLQSTAVATGLTQGTYSVCVTDLYGCTSCDSVTVGVGNCSAHFNLYPDSLVPHHYWAVNMASGVPPFKYDWNWGDGSTHDTTAFPAHQYAVAGFYNICLTITDAVGCSDSYCSSFYLLRTSSGNDANAMVSVNVVSSLTGIKVISAINSCFVYPNPNNGIFTFSYHLQSAKAELQLTDAMGRIVYNQSISGKQGEQHVTLPNLSSGVYYWELISGDKDPLKGKMVLVH